VMTAWYCSGALQLDDGGRVDCGNGLVDATARTHPHIPRRRKSTSPRRDSDGSGSPMAAARRISYCVTILARSAASWFALVIAAFFFLPPFARSSGDGRR